MVQGLVVASKVEVTLGKERVGDKQLVENKLRNRAGLRACKA